MKGTLMAESLLRIAVQKSGRLHKQSLGLLKKCGIQLEVRPNQLVCRAENYPLELLLVRDDDIPGYIEDGVCDAGIVGQNVFEEYQAPLNGEKNGEILKFLGFGKCRLSLAVPQGFEYESLNSLNHLRIATSYPEILKRFAKDHGLEIKAVEISGSVEVTPAVGVADVICDLVSTGSTLKSNGLKEVATILESQAILIKGSKSSSNLVQETLDRLIQRIDGVLKAQKARYIMMNAPRSSLEAIGELIPGMEDPTVIPLGDDGQKVAIHAVSPEEVFWETMEKLKAAGASSILVVPIEKIIE